MKAHDLAKILLSMENLEVAYQYYDGGPEHYNEPLVDNVTECEGVIYLTQGKLCVHNNIKIDVEEISCYIENPSGSFEDVYVCSFKDNIKERIEYINTTDRCRITWLDDFDDYINVTFDTQEDLDKFINTFNDENN